MSKSKKIIALMLALACVFAIFSVMASAKKATTPAIKLEVTTDKTSTRTLGRIKVTVTATNTSKKDVKNVVITSADSKGLVTKKAIQKNVRVTNPDAPELKKKDSMTTCLKPGGKMTYSYYVFLGYEYATTRIPESVHRIMYRQHKLLGLNYFKSLDISSGSAVVASGNLFFGDVSTKLVVKAFYNISNDDYDYIISENTVSTDTSDNNSGSDSSSKQANRTTAVQAPTTSVSVTSSNTVTAQEYIIDTETDKFHLPSCSYLPTVNIDKRTATAQELLDEGYIACKKCNPA